jgi:hypothetical protein
MIEMMPVRIGMTVDDRNAGHVPIVAAAAGQEDT